MVRVILLHFDAFFVHFDKLIRWPPGPLCPPTPLTENHFAKKPLAERGGTPHSGPGGRQINLSK